MAQTIIGKAAEEVISTICNNIAKWASTKQGATAIASAIGGFGLGGIVSTKQGRESIMNIASALKTAGKKIIHDKGVKTLKQGAKNLAKAALAKIAGGAGIVGAAVVAGYVTGLTLGDYFKGDAKNFGKEFAEDLGLNLIGGPAASIIKHVVRNKDMVKEDIQKNIIQPIAKAFNDVKDFVLVHGDRNAQDSADKEMRRIAPSVANAVVANAVGEANKAVVDQYASEHNMMKRPGNPQAETEWEKEVEKNMKNGNNPGWYKGRGKLISEDLLGKFNFCYPRGSEYNTPIGSNYGVPGVFMISYALNFGGCEDDYRTLSFTKAVEAIKAINKYTTSYTTLDVAHLFINTRLMYALFAYMKRAYKCLLHYDAMDKNLPYALFAAMGLDYTTWQTAMADIRNDMNLIAAKIKALPHVKMTIIDRTMQLFENIYKDDKIANPQYYLAALSDKQYYWDFSASTPAYVSTQSFVTHAVSSTSIGMTYSTFKLALLTLINATSGAVVDEITASFNNALGSWYPSLLNLPKENEEIKIDYNAEILMQFENTQFGSGSSDQTTAALSAPTDGAIIPGTLDIPASGVPRYFNFHFDKPGLDDVLVASRASNNAGTGSSYYAVPTETPRGWKVYFVNGASPYLFKLDNFGGARSVQITGSSGTIFASAFFRLSILAAFDWAPHIQLQLSYSGTSSFSNLSTNDVNVDWATYTKVNDTANGDCKMLHDLINYGNYNLYADFETIATNRNNRANAKKFGFKLDGQGQQDK